MIMNVQQNAGAPAYAPPPAPQAAPAPVIIQQEKKSNTLCIVVTTVCCLCVVLPIVGYLIVAVMFVSAASSIAGSIDSSDFTTPTSTVAFSDAGPLNFAADICSGDFKYTVTGSAGSLESPNYPSNYPSNMDCSNRIETASDGITFEINAFSTEGGWDTVVFNGQYTFDGFIPQVGDRFSFGETQVDVHFTSDSAFEYSGFSFSVIDGYEPANDVANLGYAGRIIKEEDKPEKTE